MYLIKTSKPTQKLYESMLSLIVQPTPSRCWIDIIMALSTKHALVLLTLASMPLSR